MARKAKVENNETADLVKAFVVLESFGVTQDDPVSTVDFASEMSVTDAEAFHLLDTLADAELVDAKGRGLSAEWWINVPDVSAENAESIAREALANFTPEPPQVATKATPAKAVKDAEARARLEYAANVAESQDMDAQHATPRVIPAETPVVAENGENVTIPVNFDDSSEGRRELDASKGEKLLGESTYRLSTNAEIKAGVQRIMDKVNASTPKPERLPEIDGLSQFIDDETGDMVYESRLLKNGLILPEPSEVPPCPEGVNRNMWDHAHTANTQSGRDWAMRHVNAELHNQSVNAPF